LAATVLPDRREQGGERTLARRHVDDDAERALAIMPHDQDDRMVEARIAHVGRRDQQLPGKRLVRRRARRSGRLHRTEQQGRQTQCGEHKQRAPE
jgi:hypothetical protein